jgi:hypothetical protein
MLTNEVYTIKLSSRNEENPDLPQDDSTRRGLMRTSCARHVARSRSGAGLLIKPFLPSSLRFSLSMASLATALRPATSTPGDGSRTFTVISAPPIHNDDDDSELGNSVPSGPVGVLRLRGAPKQRSRRRVVWGEDVIDNEGCGKKKSKSASFSISPCVRFDQ